MDELKSSLLTPADREVVGTLPSALNQRQAIQLVLQALKEASGADIALLNHTSFGYGLPGGPVERWQFDNFMRFDNAMTVSSVSGQQLKEILVRANQGEGTPLAQRVEDTLYATPLGQIDDGATYRIVTNSWLSAPENQERYLGLSGLHFQALPNMTTKGITIAALGKRG